MEGVHNCIAYLSSQEVLATERGTSIASALLDFLGVAIVTFGDAGFGGLRLLGRGFPPWLAAALLKADSNHERHWLCRVSGGAGTNDSADTKTLRMGGLPWTAPTSLRSWPP